MPSSKNYVRDYDQEYKTQKARGESGTGSNSDNAKRHRARREALASGKITKSQELDHIKPLSKGGSNKPSNTRASTPSKNRSYPRNADGSMKKK